MERLQKYIASSGYTSRRKAEDLIREGRVSVNGQVVTELGTKVKSGDVVLIDGEAIVGENKVYYLFYKPQGCVCTLDDEFDRPKVIDYFEEVEERIYPVGRLDFDTTGALIMSNDGEYVKLCKYEMAYDEPLEIKLVTSDDVFDYLLDIRSINSNVNRKKEELSKEYTDIKFVKVNVDNTPDIAQRYGIMSIPTLIAFKNGEIAGSIVGFQPKETLAALAEKTR